MRDQREAVDPRGQVFDSLEDLQAWTDARLEDRAHHLRCPATGTSVAAAGEQERRLLTPLPETLPFLGRSFHRKARISSSSFDIVVRRPVGPVGMVNFEGRQYEPCRSASCDSRSRFAASPAGCRCSRTAR